MTRLLFYLCLIVPFSLFAQTIEFLEIASGLHQPLAIKHAGDGSGRLFIVQQTGQIMIYDGTQVLPTAFLDISSLVSCCGERGLLGLAFHPLYENNGYFYVNYTNTAGDTVVARYQVSATDPNVANPNGTILLTIAQPYANHNGGDLHFGPDGYLYIATGDGGSGGDPQNNGQRLDTLLGKILRIDVDTSGATYEIPPTNPFVDGNNDTRDEIWVYGLRNPWRMSFDRQTGDLYIGDVGQGCWEEIDRIPGGSSGGQNFGWRVMEGKKCYDPASGCNPPPVCIQPEYVFPILDHGHTNNPCDSITGGYVYRGTLMPSFYGAYFYGDYCTGIVRVATTDGNTWTSTVLADTDFSLSSFGEDEAGELYLADLNGGKIYLLKEPSQLPYSDDFEDGTISDWNILKGTWTVVNGNLQGSSNRKAEILSPFNGCTNCTVDADIQIETTAARASLLAWYSSKTNYVELLLMEDRNRIILKQRSGGSIVAKVPADRTIDPGINYHVRIVHDGNSFQVYFNNETNPVITMNSRGLAIGTVGFRVKSTTTATATGSFQQISVF